MSPFYPPPTPRFVALEVVFAQTFDALWGIESKIIIWSSAALWGGKEELILQQMAGEKIHGAATLVQPDPRRGSVRPSPVRWNQRQGPNGEDPGATRGGLAHGNTQRSAV